MCFWWPILLLELNPVNGQVCSCKTRDKLKLLLCLCSARVRLPWSQVKIVWLYVKNNHSRSPHKRLELSAGVVKDVFKWCDRNITVLKSWLSKPYKMNWMLNRKDLFMLSWPLTWPDVIAFGKTSSSNTFESSAKGVTVTGSNHVITLHRLRYTSSRWNRKIQFPDPDVHIYILTT